MDPIIGVHSICLATFPEASRKVKKSVCVAFEFVWKKKENKLYSTREWLLPFLARNFFLGLNPPYSLVLFRIHHTALVLSVFGVSSRDDGTRRLAARGNRGVHSVGCQRPRRGRLCAGCSRCVWHTESSASAWRKGRNTQSKHADGLCAADRRS